MTITLPAGMLIGLVCWVSLQTPAVDDKNYFARRHQGRFKKGLKAKKPTSKQLAIQNLYPLSTFTDVIVRSEGPDVADLQTFIEFWLSSAEQSISKTGAQSFAPLPTAVVNFALAQVKSL